MTQNSRQQHQVPNKHVINCALSQHADARLITMETKVGHYSGHRPGEYKYKITTLVEMLLRIHFCLETLGKKAYSNLIIWVILHMKLCSVKYIQHVRTVSDSKFPTSRGFILKHILKMYIPPAPFKWVGIILLCTCHVLSRANRWKEENVPERSGEWKWH